jgi:predicted ABC-type ATPase
MHHHSWPERSWEDHFCAKVLTDQQGVLSFLNADLLAAGLSPLHPELAARAAGRLLLKEIDRHMVARTSFALESTLSGLTYLQRIERIKDLGYSVEIIFLRLSSPDLAIKRVAHRVKQGGHHVPDIDVRRRFERGWRNFELHYRPNG